MPKSNADRQYFSLYVSRKAMDLLRQFAAEQNMKITQYLREVVEQHILYLTTPTERRRDNLPAHRVEQVWVEDKQFYKLQLLAERENTAPGIIARKAIEEYLLRHSV